MEKNVQKLRALNACSSDVHVARVVVHAVIGLVLVLSARVIVVIFVVEFPYPVFCIRRKTLYISYQVALINRGSGR